MDKDLKSKGEAKSKGTCSVASLLGYVDEAQGLLKTIVSICQSKEARLPQFSTGLPSRLQEYKYENAQLEELLTIEVQKLDHFSPASHMQLQQEISKLKTKVIKGGSSTTEAFAAKNSEIEALASSIDSLKKQAALSEGNLASLEIGKLQADAEGCELRWVETFDNGGDAMGRINEFKTLSHCIFYIVLLF